MEFWEIYDQYYGKVRKFILTLVKDEWAADDLIQETFLKIQKNLNTLRDPSKIASWMFSIAYHLCQDHFRKSKQLAREERIEQDEEEDLHKVFIQKELDVQKRLEQAQMGECVQDQMSLLPESLREVLILFDMMEFSHQEIADILGISVENVKVRLHRARKKLKAILEEKCSFERDERDVLVCLPIEKKQVLPKKRLQRH